MTATTAIKVYIRNLAGEYLIGDGENWFFTPERAIAHVFDYHADQVGQQLAEAKRDHGVHWIAYPVDPALVVETCDACGEPMHPTEATFDGTHFFCPACQGNRKV
jgi:hypothetical protein